MLKGKIVKGIGGFYYIYTKKGIYECKARGIFRKENIKPIVGDNVEISIIDEKNKKGIIDIIEKRKSMLIRPLVSNVEQVVIVFSSVSPNINLDLLDKFIVLVEKQNLDILICINKIDLDNKKNYEKVKSIYENIGYKVIFLSAKMNFGIDILKKELENKISVFAGPSGVGKSSIINSLCPKFNLKTGEISLKIERGKHTTRHAELMNINENSYIVDSPGFTSLFLSNIEAEELQYYFKEFEPFLNTCKYNTCVHISEPNCSIKEQLGKMINLDRYKRYINIYNELKNDRRR